MPVHKIEVLAASSFTVLTLCACASNIAVYESPTSGRIAEITFVNAADIQEARLTTFVDGTTCTGRRQIRFENESAIRAGNTRTITAAADREFALFARLPTIESEEYGVDLGVTGSGPEPVIRRTVRAIGCNANLSFQVEPDNVYRVVLSEPKSSESCSVVVSKIDKQGESVEIETTQRTIRTPQDQSGPFCEPPGG